MLLINVESPFVRWRAGGVRLRRRAIKVHMSALGRSDPFPLPIPSININRQPRRHPSFHKHAPSEAQWVL